MKESGKRHGDACASRRLGQGLLVVPLPPSGSRPQLVHKNEPRPTPGLLRISYLVFALAAAAVLDEGSAKAITASPSKGDQNGLPPKALTTYSTPLTS